MTHAAHISEERIQEMLNPTERRICRTRWNLLEAVYQKRKEQSHPSYKRSLAILQEHTRTCKVCLDYINSFPADGPAYPETEREAEEEPKPVFFHPVPVVERVEEEPIPDQTFTYP